MNYLSNIVSTSFHVCLWSVVPNSRAAQESMNVHSFIEEAVLPLEPSSVPYLSDGKTYMPLFQTSMMVWYARLQKKKTVIRPGDICVLSATGILGYKFPVSVCSHPTTVPNPPLIFFYFCGVPSTKILPFVFLLFLCLAPAPTLQGQQSVLDSFFISIEPSIAMCW